MMMLKEAYRAAILLALLLGALPAAATTIVMPLTEDGNDTGWTAYYPSGHSISITVEDFDDSNDSNVITLSIHKTLLPPAIGEEATIGITFVGPDAPATFIISSETVRNETGSTWHGFQWILNPPDGARFDPSATSWTVSPFTGSLVWGDASYTNISLDVSGGAGVPNDSNFTPSGNLVIDTTGGFFVFKQHPMPEPASAVIVLVGAAIGFVKRRRNVR